MKQPKSSVVKLYTQTFLILLLLAPAFGQSTEESASVTADGGDTTLGEDHLVTRISVFIISS